MKRQQFNGNFYVSDEYLRKNPTLGEEDTAFKVIQIIPAVERFLECTKKSEIKMLDVGGGAGLIVQLIASHINEKHERQVQKFALDLSPGCLKIQANNNPDMQACAGDITKTSFGDKEFDLVLMIDVLEHVPEAAEALEEVRRIANYAIFKVPLEAHITGAIWNFIKGGEPRRQSLERVGHIQHYTYRSLSRELTTHTGQIVESHFTNVNAYCLYSPFYKATLKGARRWTTFAGACLFRIHPGLAASIFYDHAVYLVKCRQDS